MSGELFFPHPFHLERMLRGQGAWFAGYIEPGEAD